MNQHATRHALLSVEEYLRLEESSTVKHEYVGGEIHAMSGVTKRHARIAGNIYARLWNAARGGPCRIYTNDVKVRAADDVIYYPDVMVACGEDDGDPLVENDPCLVVEVVSPSSKITDRREKLLVYKRIPGLRAYIIVDQERRHVERHWRDDDGVWWDARLGGQGRVPFPCPETELSLDGIYEGAETPQ